MIPNGKHNSEVDVGPTRRNRAIDRIFVNFPQSTVESGSLASLETDVPGSCLDHRVAYCRAGIRRREAFMWETYSFRHQTKEAEEAFKSWIVMYNWDPVYRAVGSNAKTAEYQRILSEAVDTFFPLKTTRKKSTDLPWMSRES